MNEGIKMLNIYERRKAYFIKAFQKDTPSMRIFSFGRCNFTCPYCKRDGQLVDGNGNIISSKDYKKEDIMDSINDAVHKNEVVRLSGGDPVMFPETSLEILKTTKNLGGIGSIAHNGSSPKFVSMVADCINFAAIDVKGGKDSFHLRAGINKKISHKMYDNTFRVQELLTNKGIIVDIRTCVFRDTSLDELLSIASDINCTGNVEKKFWTLREYNPVTYCNWNKLNKETLKEYIKTIKKEYPAIKIGVRAKWVGGGIEFM